ncbi:hypothetical protein [Sphingobium sp. Leaf26]|uniref:hypothetical protein n=1 Tax=Sphingobium sp. Leaf26 TaxID=1735693 RepID=UPI001F3EDEB2|nr:hypothetical protein [Sphingobium sp. Leaf26]
MASDFIRTPFGQGGFYGTTTKRFGRLLIRSGHAAALVQHRLVLGVVETILSPWCDRIQFNTTQAIAVHPGAPAQLPHRDQKRGSQASPPPSQRAARLTFWFTDATPHRRLQLGLPVDVKGRTSPSPFFMALCRDNGRDHSAWPSIEQRIIHRRSRAYHGGPMEHPSHRQRPGEARQRSDGFKPTLSMRAFFRCLPGARRVMVRTDHRDRYASPAFSTCVTTGSSRSLRSE